MVSGSALQWEGQLTVYNYDEDTPCYRCLFPKPPAPGTVTNCADGGVIGVVPGIIGNIQALEAIKIAAGLKPSYAGTLLLFDGLTGQFRKVELRKRKDDCVSCGNNPTITDKLIDYNAFCGIKCDSVQPMKILEPEERVTVETYKQVIDSNEPHLLIDVRPQLQQDIVKLDNAISIPLGQIVKGNGVDKITELIEEKWDKNSSEKKKIFVMCRRGNASQKAVRELKNRLVTKIDDENIEIKDVIGGISAWSEKIDPELPTFLHLINTEADYNNHFQLNQTQILNDHVQIDDKHENLFWFIHISDTHLSYFRDHDRKTGLIEFCRSVIPIIKPSVLVLTGDITDARTKFPLGSEQYREEWIMYQDIREQCLKANPHLKWLDIKGNHGLFIQLEFFTIKSI
ncbi:adenylyltransferase and sulfurtransferase MOCS3-like protein [Euroglyphus maynei]|uniref:Ubiquitin activating enzyme 4 n=1 Tax=Euroglyphus maynei TaxID=6958 RepID=A0A1Y3BR55_EURMA|nr:adenylyltransferase and sulfurtransferase MOCS3-like protein [Euroglyphus maynei]